MFNSVNTNYLISVTGILGAIAWIVTMFSGMYMYGQIKIGRIVILISLGWVILTISTALYLKRKSASGLVNLSVWKLWLALSILGCSINILAGAMMEIGMYPTISYNYGVILPWLIIYSVGYLFTGLRNFNNKALSNKERLVYVVIGIVSGLLAYHLYLNPILYTDMIIALTILTLGQIVTVLLNIIFREFVS